MVDVSESLLLHSANIFFLDVFENVHVACVDITHMFITRAYLTLALRLPRSGLVLGDQGSQL